MANEQGISSISQIFNGAYNHPIPKSAFPVWVDTFKDVSNDDLRRAAHLLVKTRDKMREVTPGEITAKLYALDVIFDREEHSGGFASAPVVRALKSRYKAEEEAEGITMHEFLKQEGLENWQNATEKFSEDNYTSTAVPVHGRLE